MLKINLLPGYVAQRRITNQLLAVFITAFLVITFGLTSYYLLLYRQIGPLSQSAEQAEQIKSQIDALNSQAAAATASLAPIQANVQFISDANSYNLQYINLYQTLARYTSKRILYKSTTVAGNVMTISAYTPSIADLGRYLQVMYTEPDATAVSISAIPGYGSTNPDTADNVSLPPGVSGHLPGVAQSITSFTVYRGQITQVNSGGGGGRAASSTPMGIPGMSSAAGFPSATPAAFPGSGMGGLMGSNSSRGTGVGLFNARHDGFPVTVTLTLKEALTPPTPPGMVASPGGGTGSAFGGQGSVPGAPGMMAPPMPMAPGAPTARPLPPVGRAR